MKRNGWVAGILLLAGGAGACSNITGLDEFEVGEARPGSLLDTVEAPVNGTTASSAVTLAIGNTYLLRATGTFVTDPASMWDADAEYYNFDSPADVDNTADVGLLIDDDMVDGVRQLKWGPYNAEHVYEQLYQGRGNPIQLHYSDSHYIENEEGATLKVEIFEMP